MIDNYGMLEDVVRDSYAGVVWSHKIQEKQSDICYKNSKRWKPSILELHRLLQLELLQ